MPAIALLVKESLSWLIKVVTTPQNIELSDELIVQFCPGMKSICKQIDY